MNVFTKQKQTHSPQKQTYRYQRGKMGEGINSVSQFSHSDSLWPHQLQHTRLPCPSPTPGACSNSCPSSQWCHPNLLWSSSPPAFSLSSIRVLSSESFFTSGGQSIGFYFTISPSNEYSGLISFRIDWLDLLTVQGTLKSFLQYHSSKASIFGTQLSL